MRGEQAIGCRVEVYWEAEDEWFEGLVDAYSTERGYYIKYIDGEEQWELDAGEHSIRFLTEPESGRSEEVSAGASSSREAEDQEDTNDINQENYEEESGGDEEEEYDDDREDREQEPVELDNDEETASRTPEKEGPVKIDEAIPTLKLQKTLKPARVFMRSTSAFFRDEETLRQMRQELRQEKKILTSQVQTLTMQLAEKDQVSMTLKSELQQLKTSATLANVMRQFPRSVTHNSSFSGTTRDLFKPKTAAEWGERVLDQKLENQCLAEDLLALKTAVQDKQLAVQRKQKQRDDMSVKLSRVPRRHLCTLVDLQVEISRLLDEKRALETQSLSISLQLKPENVSSNTKISLQNELTSLEITAEKYKEELRQWDVKIDWEKARIAPLDARLVSLQQELRRYEDSQVLLRSVFLRLEPDSRDACVPMETALTAFQTLAPLDQAALTVEEMLVRLKEGGIISSSASDGQRFSFTQFVEAFDCLFKA